MQKAQTVMFCDYMPDCSIFDRELTIVQKGKVFQFSMVCDPDNWNPEILNARVEIQR